MRRKFELAWAKAHDRVARRWYFSHSQGANARDGKDPASAGPYESGGRKFAKAQILTAADVIEGARLRDPFGRTESLTKASREADDQQG